MTDTSQAICGVCGGENDSGFGYTPDERRHKIMWTCEACIPVAAKVYGAAMRDQQTRKFHFMAVTEAVFAMGDKLSEYGKTDFAEFSEDEARALFEAMMRAYQERLRKALADHEAPF